MTFSIRVRPEVESDIREAAAWYEGEQAGLGVEFEEEIAARIHWLYQNALLPRVRNRIWSIRWVYPQRFPYRIIVSRRIQS